MKKRNKYIGVITLCIVVAVIFLVTSAPTAIQTAGSPRSLPIYSVQRDDKCVSLTFDAAWGNEDTQQLIDILGKYNVKATFFIVGDWAEKYPESVKALYDAGHEVMSHSNHHDHYASLSTNQIIADLNAANERISAVTGVTPKLIRCPYGEYDNHVIDAIRSIGMEPIQWDVDSLDWKDLSASEITQRVTKGVGTGSVVLFHNAAKHTPEALPGIIEYLLSNGYKIVPVSEILLSGKYEIDHTGRMCPKENT